jgi:hypothetical protein
MREAIRRVLLGLQLGPPKQNFVTCETDSNGRFAIQKSEAANVSDGSFTIHPFFRAVSTAAKVCSRASGNLFLGLSLTAF